VVETVGASTFEQSMDAVAMHGFVGIVGFMGGRQAPLPLVQAILKRVRLQGISVASLEEHERMVAALEAIRLKPVLDAVYGFGELREAFEHLAAGRHFGKIGIDFAK
jgi:NADPH:quinone reductase-like Zn-dependent oxidoreductase